MQTEGHSAEGGDSGKRQLWDLGGPAQLRCSVPGWPTNHGAGSMQTSVE